MRQYFNTPETAKKSLETRRRLAYKRIEKRGWKVISDTSFVHCDYKWTKTTKTPSGMYFTEQTKDLKWYVNLLILTDEMIQDLLAINPLSTHETKPPVGPNILI